MTASATLSTENHTTRHIAIPVETLAYAVILLIALGLRGARLGEAPLNEKEAQQAIAALHLVAPRTPGTGAIESPLVFAGAALSFALAGASNAAARFLPMLGGAGLVIAPLAFRHRLGRFPALVASAWLAISPVAVVASRHMSGVGLAMLALVIALAALDRYLAQGHRQAITLVGVACGVALLADYGTLAAVITVVLGFVFALLTDEEGLLTRDLLRDIFRSVPWSLFVTGLLGTVVLLGTLFFLAPAGLGAAADQLARFVMGIVRPLAGVAYPGLILPLYDPALLVFGLIGAWLASQSPEPWQRTLAGWSIAAVIIILIYRGAMPEHALWAVVPLTALAGLAVYRMLETPSAGPAWGPWVTGGGVIALLTMTGAALVQYLRAPQFLPIPPDAPPGQAALNIPLDLTLAVLWVILLVVLWLSIANLWGTQTAWRGMGIGVLIAGIVPVIGGSGSLAFSRATSPFEPLNAIPAQPALNELVGTAREVSTFVTGFDHDATITVQANPDGMLAWALRDFRQVEFVSQPDPQVNSVMVITSAGETNPALGSNYVGQDFPILRSWTPRGLNLTQAIQWLFYRTAPTLPGEFRVILWVREDVYRLTPED